MKWGPFAVVSFAAFALCAGEAFAAEPHIGRIVIENGELFQESGLRDGFYRAANALHAPTPASLIRRFLLFREGDVYDAEKIAETERNLRKLDFLSDVSITTCSEDDGSIDVTVRTRDAWTTDPAIDMSHQSAAKSFAATVTQKDVFGTAADVSVTMGSDVKRSTKKIEIDDPSFVLPYLNVEATLAANSDGFQRHLLVERPFFSYDTRFAFDALFDRTRENDRTYQDGKVAALFQRSHGEEMLRLSYSLFNDSVVQQRLTLDYDDVYDRFSTLYNGLGTAPPSHQFHFFDVGYSFFDDRYAKLAWVDQERVDDFHLGTQFDARLGVDPTTSQRIWRASMDASHGFELGSNMYLFPRVAWSARHEPGGLRNELASTDLRFLWKHDGTHPSALVSRLRLDLGHDLDPETQLFADGLSGMRAYPAFAFEGSRRAIFNLEERWFLGHEVLQIFSPGVAAFIDAGTASDAVPAFRDFKKDFGVGLRLGISKFGSTTLRFDAAYALDPSPTHKRGLVFSFGTSHAF